ncbi:mitochondrial carrier [Clavulina sp. PMI_390]|nr:mitochondrial carrier [Clavulina sp. PMI_390]
MSTTASADGSQPSSRKKKSQGRIWRTFIAGGVAGSVAKTAVAPLDRVKILFQASNPDYLKYSGNWTGLAQAIRQIRRNDGLRGLFQGHSATLLRIFPYAAVKYVAYDQAHNYLMPTAADETNLLRFAAGAFSGTASVLLTYPLEVIRVRLAFETHSQSRPTLSGIIRTIYNEGNPSASLASSLSNSTASSPPSTSSSPIPQLSQRSIFSRFPLLKFYRGYAVTLIGMVPYAGTSFLVWGNLRARFIPVQEPASPSSPVADLIIGAIAGATSQTVSYPFEIIRRRMQVGGLVQPDRWVGFGETVRKIYGQSGWRGFYVGLSIGYIKIVPMTAVSFATWEGMKRFFDV